MEFKEMRKGDTIKYKDSSDVYIVTAISCDFVVLTETKILLQPGNWELVSNIDVENKEEKWGDEKGLKTKPKQ